MNILKIVYIGSVDAALCSRAFGFGSAPRQGIVSPSDGCKPNGRAIGKLSEAIFYLSTGYLPFRQPFFASVDAVPAYFGPGEKIVSPIAGYMRAGSTANSSASGSSNFL
jgi:hypothetical protein